MFFAKLAHILRNTAISVRLFVAFSIVVSVFSFNEIAWCKTPCKTKKKAAHQLTARSVYAVDFTNNKVLSSRNPRMKLQPASTVKLLTGLVVLENIDLNKEVIIKKRALNVEPTKAGLTGGATYSVRELLEVLLATSANDAGIALADAVAGGQREFAALMNKKAKSLGCINSNFTNSTGLPDKAQLTTTYDMNIITRTAFSNSFIKSVMEKKTVTITGSDGKKITRRNHNKLLWRLSYPVVLGKTGYTRSARHCFAGVAYYKNKKISFVIMNSRKPWDDIYAILGIKQKKKKS